MQASGAGPGADGQTEQPAGQDAENETTPAQVIPLPLCDARKRQVSGAARGAVIIVRRLVPGAVWLGAAGSRTRSRA